MNYELLKEFIECAKREVGLRRRVYPRLIAQGKMKQETADKEIKLMAGIAAAFQKIYSGNAPEVQQQLFKADEFRQQNKEQYNGRFY